MLLADAPAAAIDTLVALTGPDADTPLLSIEVRHLGGALAREAPDSDVALPRAAYDRLREIKPIYDPDQAIVSAHPVRPARAHL